MSYRQRGVTIGGKPHRVTEDGKFVPITPETAPVGDQDGQNGNNLRQEDA